MNAPPGGPAPAPAAARGLWTVLLIVGFNSIGTGAIMNGVFFLARQRHGFDEQHNLLLGLVLGATYIIGAVGIGPMLRRFTATTGRGPRAALVLIHGAMGLLCFVPLGASDRWGIWIFAFAYSPLTGALWPVVESYISGGRRGQSLRHAVGMFNLVWASAVVAAYWAMSMVLGERQPSDPGAFTGGGGVNPMLVIAAIGVIHILTVALVLRLCAAPARHLTETHEPHPRVYVDLLRATRWLLVLSYILVCALNPILPTRLEAIGADAETGVRIASAWAISRLGVFLLMQRWHGWHGRWRTTIWAGGTLAVGFAMTVLGSSIPLMIAGLAVFGVGVGGVYCAALYYAMEVGAAEVEAGGKHEALIGLGYTAGPFIGLIPWWAHDAGMLSTTRIAPSIVALAVAAGCIAMIGALWPIRSRLLRSIMT